MVESEHGGMGHGLADRAGAPRFGKGIEGGQAQDRRRDGLAQPRTVLVVLSPASIAPAWPRAWIAASPMHSRLLRSWSLPRDSRHRDGAKNARGSAGGRWRSGTACLVFAAHGRPNARDHGLSQCAMAFIVGHVA